MASPYDRFDAAAGAAACDTLTAFGSGLVTAGAYSLVTGAGGALLLPGMAALLASRYACSWDPDGPPPPNKGTGFTGCAEVENGRLLAQILREDGWSTNTSGLTRIDSMFLEPVFEPGIGIIRYSGRLVGWNPDIGTVDFRISGPKEFGGACRSIIDPDSVGPDTRCISEAPGPKPDIPRTVYEDPDSGCTLNVDFQGVATGQGGEASFVYKISPAEELRADGGVIGGCNFSPVIYMTDPGGGGGGSPGPYVGPWNPDWDGGGPTPWGDFLRDLAGGLIGNILFDKLQDLVEIPFDPVEYRIDPSCNSSDPPELPVVIEVPYLKGLQSVITRIDALVPLLQAQKDLKQPICNVRPTREGEWRTISFRSEETSPFGSGRLRKRFRYLSLSGFGLEQLVDYWAGFSFEAGPVIVSHIGASWGEPKVWAATADEGKRVIRHAGGEAGLDPDQVGQWQISSSRNPRFGVSGTMNIDTTGGYYWITCRDGSSERPIVAKT